MLVCTGKIGEAGDLVGMAKLGMEVEEILAADPDLNGLSNPRGIQYVANCIYSMDIAVIFGHCSFEVGAVL